MLYFQLFIIVCYLANKVLLLKGCPVDRVMSNADKSERPETGYGAMPVLRGRPLCAVR